MYRTGDIVKVVNHRLMPEYVGKIGKISKVYPTFDSEEEVFYRINVGGKLIKGLAREKDFEFLSPSEK